MLGSQGIVVKCTAAIFFPKVDCNALSVLWSQKEVVDSPDIPVQSFVLKDLLTDPGVLHTAAFGLQSMSKSFGTFQ